MNVPFVRVALALGPEAIVEVARAHGHRVAARAGAEPRARRGRGLAARAGARLRAARERRRARRAVRSAFHVADARGPALLEAPPRARARVRPGRGRARDLRARGRRGRAARARAARARLPRARAPARPAPRTTRATPGSSATRRSSWPRSGWASTTARPLGLTGARAALPIFGRFLIAALGAEGGRDFAGAARPRVRRDPRADGPARGLPVLGRARVVPGRHRAARALRARLVRARAPPPPEPAAPPGAERPPRRVRIRSGASSGCSGAHRGSCAGAVTRCEAAPADLHPFFRSSGDPPGD